VYIPTVNARLFGKIDTRRKLLYLNDLTPNFEDGSHRTAQRHKTTFESYSVIVCRVLSVLPLIVLSLALSSAPPAGPRFGAGCVSVAADGMSLHELLTAWARIGQVKITGLDQLPDRPITLHVQCADERRTLEALLDNVDRLMVPR
jgi:hypothetical protein